PRPSGRRVATAAGSGFQEPEGGQELPVGQLGQESVGSPAPGIAGRTDSELPSEKGRSRAGEAEGPGARRRGEVPGRRPVLPAVDGVWLADAIPPSYLGRA